MKSFIPPGLVLLGALHGCMESPSYRGGLALEVAPLDLPGVTNVCYDLRVTQPAKGSPEIVWAAGAIGTPSPGDTETLCSAQYGTGAGDITFVGSCDASATETSVQLHIDSIWEGTTPILDFVDPCPADPVVPEKGGCTIKTTCLENQDVLVTFNLTVMRRAQQGFFDIGVNFNDVFCSAKLDCTYDAAGTQPIELLFDPDTGTRSQTAVLALACSAGPGEDTVLHVSDVALRCGDTATTPWSEVGTHDMASFCFESQGDPHVVGGSFSYDFESEGGVVTSRSPVDSTKVFPANADGLPVVDGGSWTIDATQTGPSVTRSALPKTVDGVTYDGVFPELPLGVSSNGSLVLARLADYASTPQLVSSYTPSSDPVTAGSPDVMATLVSAIGHMDFGVFAFSASTWAAVEKLDLSWGSNGPRMEPRLVDPATASVIAFVDGQTDFRSDSQVDEVYAIPRLSTGPKLYGEPVRVGATSVGETCHLSDTGHGLITGLCGSEGAWTPTLIDLANLQPTGTPATATPTFLPWPIVADAVVDAFVDPWRNALVSPVIVDADHVLFTAGVRFPSEPQANPVIFVATRSDNGWQLSQLFSGSIGTQGSFSSFLRMRECQSNKGYCPSRPESNGVFWGHRDTVDGQSSTRKRFVGWYANNILTLHEEVITQNDSDAMPMYAWRDASDVFVILPTIGLSSMDVVRRFPQSGPSSDRNLGKIGELMAVVGFVKQTDYHLVLVSSSETYEIRQVPASGAILEVGSFGDASTQLMTSDPGTNADQGDDALVSGPCDTFLTANTYVEGYHADPQGNYLSFWRDVTLRLVAADSADELPLPHASTAPDHLYPLARYRQEIVSPVACYAKGGSTKILGFSDFYDIDLTRDGVDVYEFAKGTGLWSSASWDSAGASFSTPTRIDTTSQPPLNPGQVYAPEIRRMAGALSSNNVTQHFAVGSLSIHDTTIVTGATVVRQDLAVFREAASGWEIVQTVSLPGGFRPDSVDIQSIDTVSRTIFGSATRVDGSHAWLFFRASTSGGNLTYNAPVVLNIPSGQLDCSPTYRAFGHWVFQCQGADNVTRLWSVSLASLTAATSSVTPVELVPPTAPVGKTWGQCSARGDALDADHIVMNCELTGTSTVNHPIYVALGSSPVATDLIGEGGLDVGLGLGNNVHNVGGMSVHNGYMSWSYGRGFEDIAHVTASGELWRWGRLPSQSGEDRRFWVLGAWEHDEGGTPQRMALVAESIGDQNSNYSLTGWLRLVRLTEACLDATTPCVGYRTVEVIASVQIPADWPASSLATPPSMRRTSATEYTALFYYSTSEFAAVLLHISANAGVWSMQLAPISAQALAQGLPADVQPWIGVGVSEDPTWTPSFADDVLNPRPCDGLILTRYYSSGETGVETTFIASIDPDKAISSGGGLPAHTVAVALPGDPDAPTESVTYDFQPAFTGYTNLALNPAEGPGNVWADGSDPAPADPFWQFATYRGEEDLMCDGQSCSKQYWNIAIGFDPGAANCEVEYLATAGAATDFNTSGQPVSQGAWPVIHYHATLTGPGGATPDDLSNLVCTQNPVDGPGSDVVTHYLSDPTFCHSFDGKKPDSVPGCVTSFPDSP